MLPPCPARHARKASVGRPVARQMISSLNFRVSWKPVNPQECVWKNESLLNCHEDHVAGRGDNSQQHYNLVYKFISMPHAMKTPAAKAAVDKLEKIPAWNQTKVRSKSEVIDEARTSGATVHFASLMDICHLKNAELEAKHQKYKRSSCAPRRHRERWFRMQYLLNKDHLHHKWLQLRSWISSPDYQVAIDKQRTKYLLIPRSKRKMLQKYWKFPNRNVQYGRPSRSSWAKSFWSFFGSIVMGKAIWEKFI